MKKTAIFLFLLSSTAFAVPGDYINPTCHDNFNYSGTIKIGCHRDVNFYFATINNTNTRQTLHVKMNLTVPGLINRTKEYDVNVEPGFYSFPPDFICDVYKAKGPQLDVIKVTMDVTGFTTIHGEQSCFSRIYA